MLKAFGNKWMTLNALDFLFKCSTHIRQYASAFWTSLRPRIILSHLKETL